MRNSMEESDPITGDLSYEQNLQTEPANKIILEYIQGLWNQDDIILEENENNVTTFEEMLEDLDIQFEDEYDLNKPKEENVFLELVPMNELQKAYIYTDKYPFLELRKRINLMMAHISYRTLKFVKNPIFEYVTLSMIVFNSVVLAIDDPTTNVQSSFQDTMDIVFIIFYSAEAFLKMIALGFIFNKGSYLRDTWNILDFTVIVTGALPYLIDSSVNLNSLRSLRVLRPLRTISSIKALRSIIMALFASFSQLSNAVLVLIFAFTVFAIAGLQLFMGYSKQRCFAGLNGIVQMSGYGVDEAFCATSQDCPTNFICGKMSSSPQKDLISFDNFYISFLQIFVIQTTEGWTDIMQTAQLTFSQFSVLYFMLIIIIVTFFLINLMLAIINLNFQRARISNAPIVVEDLSYNLKQLKQIGIYKSAIPEFTTRKQQQHLSLTKVVLNKAKEKRKTMYKVDQKPQIKIKFKNLDIKEYSQPINLNISDGRQIRLQGIYGVNSGQHLNAIDNVLPPRTSVVDPNFGIFNNLNVFVRADYRKSSYVKVQRSSKDNSNEKQEANHPKKLSQINQQSSQRSQLASPNTYHQSPGAMEFLDDITPNNRFNQKKGSSALVQFNQKSEKQIEKPDEDRLSLTLSEIQSIPNSQVEQEFEDLEIQNYAQQRKNILNDQNNNQQKAKKQRPKRKVKELQVLEESKDADKLKIRLFQTKLIPRVLENKQYISESANDILEQKYRIRLLAQQKAREDAVKQIRKRMRYNFSNKIKILNISRSNFQKTKGNNSDSKVHPIAGGTSHGQANSQQVNSKSENKRIERTEKVKKQQQSEIQVSFTQAQELINQELSNVNLEAYVIAEPENQDHKEEYHQDSIFCQEYYKIKLKDISSATEYLETECSYQDIIEIPDHKYVDQTFQASIRSIYFALNYDEDAYFIYLAGFIGILKNIQRKILYLVESQYFLFIMNMAVAANTFVLALNGLVTQTSVFDQLNLFFTILFSIELGLKIIGYGPKQFINDPMNLFDACIVAISIVDLAVFSKGGKSSLGAVRAFRAMRVLRITKLMRTLPFMKFLIAVLSNAASSLFYTFLLLFLFIYIFTLLGMSFFGGTLTGVMRLTYDSFLYGFISVFSIVTLSNWNNFLYSLLQSGAPSYVVIPYLVSWIFIGNYVLMNLFLSSLLDSFDEEYNKQQDELKELNEEDYQTMSVHSKSNAVSQAFNPEVVKKKEFKYFQEPGLCQYSLYIFSQQNIIRKLIYRLAKNTYFEWLVLAVIILSSVKLGIDTYVQNFQPWMNFFFAFFFGVESALKIISFGFVLDKSSYLRDNWNRLDFIIVICSFIDVFVSSIDLSFVKILRLLRALRPLRLISQNKSMRLLVTTLINSAGGIIGVGVVMLLTMAMFGILGVNLMSGKLNYCSYGDIYAYNKQTCPNGYWTNHQYNFDNILDALVNLFVLNTMEDWNNYMFYFIDADENGPILNNNLYFCSFFIVYILLVSVLLMNMFIGVILVNYKIADDEARDKSVSEEQENWISTQKLIIDSNPNFALYYAPDNYYRAFVFNIVSHRYFDSFIMMTIVGNICLLASYYDDAPPSYTDTLETVNLVFSVIFIGEAFLKIVSFGFTGYFRNNSNQFDFFVTCTSVLDMIISFIGTSSGFLKSAPQIIRIFRVLRVTRLFRLIRQLPELKKLIDTAIFSLPALLNVSLLMFLIFFILAILGVFLFSGINQGQLISWLNNFHNFHQAFLLVFRGITGENWYLLMYDTMDQANYWASLYWILLEVLQGQIMLNLFVLIILDQYEMFYFKENNPLKLFKEFETDFVEVWAPLAADSLGQSIHQRKLMNLMLNLKEPLGYDIDSKMDQEVSDWKTINKDADDSKENLIKIKQLIMAKAKRSVSMKIMQMGLSTDTNLRIEYHYALFAFMKNFQKEQLQAFVSQEGTQKLQQKEEQTLAKIRNKRQVQNDVNPCVQLLFVMMCFKAFKRFQFKQKNKVRLEGKDFSEKNQDSSYEWLSQQKYTEKSGSSHESIENEQIFVDIPNLDVYRDNIDKIMSEEDENKVKSLESSKSDSLHSKKLYKVNFEDKY